MRDSQKKRRYNNWRSFEEARAYVQSLGLKNHAEWRVWSKSDAKPDDISAYPNQVYKAQGWVSFGDWLGTGTIANQNRTYRPFEEARAFVHNLRLKSRAEWRAWSKSDAKPDDIPANPPQVYKKKGWVSWGDWFGTGTIASYNRTYRPFEEAHTFVRSLGLKNLTEWVAWAKSDAKPDDIPAKPYRVYKDKGWVSLGDWLGTGTIANQNRVYRSFKEARAYVHSLELKSVSEWRSWAKKDAKPEDIPAYPNEVYSNQGWVDWGDWLGTGTIAPFNRTYRPFEETRTFVHSLGLKSVSEWKDWSKSGDKPDDIPANPHQTYKDQGWTSWGDWLGTGTIASYNRMALS